MLLFTAVCSRCLEESGFKFLQQRPVYLVRGIDRFAFASSPYGSDAPRPYRRALCAP